MNWIWEDSVSSITIDRHLPCLETFLKIEQHSINQLAEYVNEFKRSVRKFQEIYPGLKVMVEYEYDPGVSVSDIGPLLEGVYQPLVSLGKTKVALVNSGHHLNVLPVEVFSGRLQGDFEVRHFDEKGPARFWLAQVQRSIL
jgi:hypothetical protein